MAPKRIHLMGIDPGGSTGWCCLTVSRLCIFGDEPAHIAEWDYGVFHGHEPTQAEGIARLAREIQSLDYKVGPALVIEGWTIDPSFKSRDEETLSPVRLGAMLQLLQHQKKLGDCTLTFQNRTAKEATAVSDDRLRRLHMYVANPHIRDATKHAIMGLRRARENPEFAAGLWPYLANDVTRSLSGSGKPALLARRLTTGGKFPPGKGRTPCPFARLSSLWRLSSRS